MKWFINTKEDLQKLRVEEEDIYDRDKFRQKTNDKRISLTVQSTRGEGTGRRWTDERRKEHSERMKAFWADKRNDILRRRHQNA